jgi:23S rRNA (cytidine1920-2'-O)/16S rRNA (cytidine1409-2'-O)-methyltransferase
MLNDEQSVTTGTAAEAMAEREDAAAMTTGSERRRTPRERLDLLLVRRGLAPTRERARALVMAGAVRVDGRVAPKAGALTAVDAAIEIASQPAETRYVSRGGLKLERALEAFCLDPAGQVCLDVGASTGGFTDVLLRAGARRVYAVDVGYGQLAWSLRTDPRVVTMERTNIRTLSALPEVMDAAVLDVSFISLRLVLPPVATLLAPGAWVVALVKPQFEAGRAEADRGGGVISDPQIHLRVLRDLVEWLREWPKRAPEAPRLIPGGLIGSPIAGREGNHEYLLELRAQDVRDDGPAPMPLDDAALRRIIKDTFAPRAAAEDKETAEDDGCATS